MKYELIDDILHIVIEKESDKTTDAYKTIIAISQMYEGNTVQANAVGLNFPISYCKKYKMFSSYIDKAKYVILYKKGDKQTKIHELCHAKYFLNSLYRESVNSLWESLDKNRRRYITEMLKRMGYSDHVLIDEFQAYYYTEKSNFFGKL